MSNSPRAGRAIGAMFFSVFGTLWILAWTWQTHAGHWLMHIATGGLGVSLLMYAIKIYRENADSSQVLTAADKRTERNFHLINAGQWLVIFIVANVLINLGQAEWVQMSIIFIVGLHFIPMARLFNYVPHYLLGTAIMLWAVCYPLICSGPADPLGCLGMGLLLWSGALYALHHKTTSVQLSV